MSYINYTICFLLLSILVHSQNKQNKKTTYKQQTDSIISIYKNANKLDSLAYITHKATLYFNSKRQYKKAIYYALQEVQYGKTVLSQKKYKNAIYNLAFFYLKNEEYIKSITHYKKVIDSFPLSKKTYNAYCEIGRNLKNLGDYHQAISYYQKGLSQPDSLKQKNYFSHTINLVGIYYHIDSKEGSKEEMKTLKRADSVFKNLPFNERKFHSLHNNFGNFYNNKKYNFNFNKSKFHYKQQEKRALINNDTIILITNYNSLGHLYNKEKKDSASYYLKKGLNLADNKNSTKPLLRSNLAEYYAINNKNRLALKELQKSLQLIVPKSNNIHYNDTIKLSNAALSNNKYLVLDNLKDKAKLFLKLSTTNKNNATLALQHLKLADKVLNLIKADNFDTESKLFWQELASELYLLAVEACFILNKPKEAFYFIEKNKAILLLENIDESELKLNIGISDSILQKEYYFKKTIADLENKLNEHDSDFNTVEQNYYSTKINYKNFIESLKKQYPDYYNYKTPLTITTLQESQKNLDKDTAVLEYIFDGTTAYVLCITTNEIYLHKLEDNLQHKIDGYLKLISSPLKTTTQQKNYTKQANELQQLLMPFLKEQNFNKKKLIIIPDYTLQNLPFESLKKDNTYLIEDFEISYEYSLSFSKKNKALKRQAKSPFIGFAPYTFNYDNLQTLPRSKTETKTIAELTTGIHLTESNATKANFLSKINDYKIIHLSTHANANDSISPWIAFKNEKLFLNELNTIKTQADLVVLNTCKSSLGKINNGEGVFSLARGFFYSGANSVISSLWNVNDKSNTKITTSFYKYLKKGNTKSQALRQAKLDYLKTHTLSEASPYYWSSLILIGDTAPIKISNNNWIYYLLSIIIILVFIIILKKRKKIG